MMEERDKIGLFQGAAKEIYERISQERGYGLILYNDDGDGICSGSILAQLLEALGKRYYMACLGKIFPQVLELVDEAPWDFLVFTDLGSGAMDIISKTIKREGRIYILDHHDPRMVEDGRILHLNPELYGLTGERAASSATVAYLTARNMGEEALKLAWMAVVGSAEIPGSIGWLNWIPLQDAIKAGDAVRTLRGDRETVKISALGRSRDYRALNRDLTILGSVGYFEEGPQEAVSTCIFRRVEGLWERVKGLEGRRKEAFKELRGRLERDGLYALEKIQWFDAGALFKGMGTKVIGKFCSHLRYQTRIVHREKYILGFMDMGNEVPGLGRIEGDWKKVSCRVPLRVEGLIERGIRQPVSALIEASAFHSGGHGDGHGVAGSAVIPKGSVEAFLTTFNRLAGERVG